VAGALVDVFNLPNAPASKAPPPPGLLQNARWRCLDGKVYACDPGVNIPCDAKADTSTVPSPAMQSFCTANPDNPIIPASTVGHTSVYEWRCTGGAPAVIRQFVVPDSRGYLPQLWTAVQPGR
jgi:hypothetical protein